MSALISTKKTYIDPGELPELDGSILASGGLYTQLYREQTRRPPAAASTPQRIGLRTA